MHIILHSFKMECNHSSTWKPLKTKKGIRKSEKDAQKTEPFEKAILAPRKVFYSPTRDYEKVKANLIHMQDNGDFEKFDKYSNCILEKYRTSKDFDILAAVTNEKAQCAIYRNDLRAARLYANKGHELAERTRCPPVFHAQAFLVMSNISRYQSKLGLTKNNLDKARQCFAFGYSTEDLAHHYELYGSYLDKFLGIFPKESEKAKKLAVNNFNKMNEIGSQDSEPRVSYKKRVYAMIRIARIWLDSNSQFGREKREVTDNDIRQATECVEVIKRERLLENMPRGTKIQFQMVLGDLCYRKKEFEDAISWLKKCLDQAKQFGYETEGPKIIQV